VIGRAVGDPGAPGQAAIRPAGADRRAVPDRPGTGDGRGRVVAGRILRAPVAGRTWRELAYVLVSLVPAVLTFLLAVLGVIASALSLISVGLPILIGVLITTRPANRMVRLPARLVLGWDWPLPPPVRARGAVGRARAVLRDGSRWRALVYCLVKLPLTALAVYIAVVSLVVGLVFLTCPLWWFATPTGLGLVDDTSWAGTWVLALQALGVLLVWPWFLRLLVNLDRALVRALLEPTADRARIVELQASRAVLAADAATLLRKLERDLHDGTQARLVSLGLVLGRIGRRVDDPEVATMVADAKGTVSDALAELRDIVRGIHPPALDDGLPTAVATLAARSAIPVETEVRLNTRPSDATATALYYSVAELLTNVARHAGATRARLRLSDDDGGFLLVVTDDGHGGAGLNGAGTGLAGLARRAEALDGRLDITSPRGGPTAVTMMLPREV
jgi:signal transduction histidine kinase